MTTKEIIELIAASTMVIGLIAVMWHRIQTEMGLGARTTQFIAVVFIIPVILILALEGALEPQTTATLIGAMTGYLLSGVGGYEPGKSKALPSKNQLAQPSVSTDTPQAPRR